jgi:hypothetical protein
MHFMRDESGAVATDWVVISAGVVGLGIAAFATVSSGAENLSLDIQALLANTAVGLSGAMEQVAWFDFTGGLAPGWTGGQVMDMGGVLGELMVLGPGQGTGFLLEVPANAGQASMTFDLIAGDSLDNGGQWGNDTATMMLNGVPVAIAANSHNNAITVEIPQVDGTTVEALVTVNSQHMGGSNTWDESVANVSVDVMDPSSDIQFEMVSNANQGINDEFWGIDNFDASVGGS